MDLSHSDHCQACVVQSVTPFALESVCEEFATKQICSLFDSCSCSVCQEVLVDYFTCTYSKGYGCVFDCATLNDSSLGENNGNDSPGEEPLVPPLPPPTDSATDPANGESPSETKIQTGVCSDKRFAFTSCLLYSPEISLTGSKQCQECGEDVLVRAPFLLNLLECDRVESVVCATLRHCDCGICTAEASEYVSCQLGTLTPGNTCEMDCTSGDYGDDVSIPVTDVDVESSAAATSVHSSFAIRLLHVALSAFVALLASCAFSG